MEHIRLQETSGNHLIRTCVQSFKDRSGCSGLCSCFENLQGWRLYRLSGQLRQWLTTDCGFFFLRFSQDFPCCRLWLLPPVHFLWTSEKSPASSPPQYTFRQLDTTACFSGWANLSSYLIMCSSPQQTWWPWLNSFELVCVILVPKNQKETQYSSKQETEWDNHFPQPAGYALADTVALLPQGHTVDFWPVWHPPRSFSAKLLPHFSSQSPAMVLLHSRCGVSDSWGSHVFSLSYPSE